MTYIDTHVALLKKQREDYNARQIAETSPILKSIRSILGTDTTDLAIAVAEQSKQLAEMQQALLTIAKAQATLQQSNLAILDGVDTVKEQTKKRIKPWDKCEAELTDLWEQIRVANTQFNQDVEWTTLDRGFQAFMSFGIRAKSIIQQVKQQVYGHVARIDALLNSMDALVEYTQTYHPDQINDWLRCNYSVTVGKKSWTVGEVLDADWTAEYQTALLALRGL